MKHLFIVNPTAGGKDKTEEVRAKVQAAFAGREDYEPLDFDGLLGARSTDGMLQLWPQRHGTDGFFIALMRKRT